MLYDSALFSQYTDQIYKSSLLESIEANSRTVTEFSRHLFGDPDAVDYGTMSPYVPYSLYQSAIVQYRLWKQTGDIKYQDGLGSQKDILGYFERRWLIGGEFGGF